MKRRAFVLILLCLLLFTGCRTTAPKRDITIPDFNAIRPSMVPADLVKEPATVEDVLLNSIRFEYALYDWQDYAEALESYIEQLKTILEK